MKREVAFALKSDTLGRTRASKVGMNNGAPPTVYKRKYKNKSLLKSSELNNGSVDRVSEVGGEGCDRVSENVENKRLKSDSVVATVNGGGEVGVDKDGVCVVEKNDVCGGMEIIENGVVRVIEENGNGSVRVTEVIEKDFICVTEEKIVEECNLVIPVSDDGAYERSDSLVGGSGKETGVSSNSAEEKENDVLEIVVREEKNCNFVGSGCFVGTSTHSIQESEDGIVNPLTNKEDITGASPVLYDVKTQNGTSEKFSRRFTRSALKVKVEPVEVSVLVDDSSNIGSKAETIPKIKEEETTILGVSATPNNNMELKMLKKIAVSKVPSTVRELLETGLLEGFRVTYNGGKKRASGLQGIIQGDGILCSCSLCKGCRVIPPSKFEIHACNSYRRAAEYICLDNGKSFIEILKAVRDTRRDTVGARIQNAIGSMPREGPVICKICNESYPASVAAKIGPLCKSCLNQEQAQESPVIVADTKSGLLSRSLEPVLVSQSPRSASMCISSQTTSGRRIKKKSSNWKSVSKSPRNASLSLSPQKRSQKKTTEKPLTPILVLKSPKKASLSVSPQKRSQWKITKKDLRLHKLVFEENGLPDGTELGYYARGKKLLGGYKKGSGIFCFCCNSEVSASQFEAHAGCATRRKPYSYIYTSNGVSLHELSVSLLKGIKHAAKDNDDLCIICADGGNLVLCDGCPRAFHKECASLPSIPRGKWYCQYCQNMFEREKFVAHNVNAVAAGRVSGVDPIEQITQRCIRIVKSKDTETESACVLCRGYDFSKSGFGPRTIILCDQCEMEFHVGCLRKHKMADLKELPRGKWFCCVNCKTIHSALRKLLVRGEEKLPDSLLTVIKKKLEDKGLDSTTDLDIRWRLLSGKIASPETRLLLSKAVAIFHDCFDPIIDQTTRRDLIPSMVYGRTLGGQEFGGMYCAVLMVNSCVVSAGILRVYGQEVAEIPLVATCKDNQDKGYFQLLFSCIEKLLAYMKVRNIVLPAAEEAESIWTDRFGFSKIGPNQLSNLRKNYYQMMTFQGTSMLQKTVPECRILQNNAR